METEKESIPFRANKVKQFQQALAKREVFALNKQKGKPEEWQQYFQPLRKQSSRIGWSKSLSGGGESEQQLQNHLKKNLPTRFHHLQNYFNLLFPLKKKKKDSLYSFEFDL